MSEVSSPFLVYDLTSGRILKHGFVPEDMRDAQITDPVTEAVLYEDVNSETYYIVDGVVTPRPVVAFDKLLINADDADEAELSPAPEGSLIYVNGAHVATVETDGFIFTAAHAGSYLVRVEPPFPYRELEVEIVAI